MYIALNFTQKASSVNSLQSIINFKTVASLFALFTNLIIQKYFTVNIKLIFSVPIPVFSIKLVILTFTYIYIHAEQVCYVKNQLKS